MKVPFLLLFLCYLVAYPTPDPADYCNWDIRGGCPERYYTEWGCLAELKSCPQGKQYHCTRQKDNEQEFIDGCAVSKDCLAGEAPYLVYRYNGIDTDDLHIECRDCHNKERFNSAESTNSSMYYQCTSKVQCDEINGKECNPKDPDSKDIYKYNRQCSCNARENYVFAHEGEDRHKMCTSSGGVQGKLRCQKAAPCPSGEERMLNYTCGKKCVIGYRTNTSDECVLPYSTSNTITPNTPAYSSKVTSNISSAASPPTEKTTDTTTTATTTTTTSDTGISTQSDASTGISIGVGSGLVVIIVIVAVVCWYRRRGRSEVHQVYCFWRRRRETHQADGEDGEGAALNSADGADREGAASNSADARAEESALQDAAERIPFQDVALPNNGKSNNREYRDINYEDIHGLNEDELNALAKTMMRNRELFLGLMMNKTKNILDGIHSIDNLMRDTLESTLRRKSDLHEEDSNRDILVHISTQGFNGYTNFKKILMHLISESDSQKLLMEERRVADCIKEKRKDQANDNDGDDDDDDNENEPVIDEDSSKGAEAPLINKTEKRKDQANDNDGDDDDDDNENEPVIDEDSSKGAEAPLINKTEKRKDQANDNDGDDDDDDNENEPVIDEDSSKGAEAPLINKTEKRKDQANDNDGDDDDDDDNNENEPLIDEDSSKGAEAPLINKTEKRKGQANDNDGDDDDDDNENEPVIDEDSSKGAEAPLINKTEKRKDQANDNDGDDDDDDDNENEPVIDEDSSKGAEAPLINKTDGRDQSLD